MKTALITGITGQDGAYLAQFLLAKNYRVIGAERRASTRNRMRLDELGITQAIEFADFDLADQGNMVRVLQKYEPAEVYNLAAQSFVALSFEQPIMTGDITGVGVTRLLESIRAVNPAVRFYQASTSEMFGKAQTVPQNEQTPFYPRSPYASPNSTRTGRRSITARPTTCSPVPASFLITRAHCGASSS